MDVESIPRYVMQARVEPLPEQYLLSPAGLFLITFNGEKAPSITMSDEESIEGDAL